MTSKRISLLISISTGLAIHGYQRYHGGTPWGSSYVANSAKDQNIWEKEEKLRRDRMLSGQQQSGKSEKMPICK